MPRRRPKSSARITSSERGRRPRFRRVCDAAAEARGRNYVAGAALRSADSNRRVRDEAINGIRPSAVLTPQVGGQTIRGLCPRRGTQAVNGGRL
jgi:hypothetical protein